MTFTISRAFSRIIFLLVIWSSMVIREAIATCYLPDYIQGEYLMQNGFAMHSQVQYTSVSISSEAVSTWGYCHRKLSNDLYLIDHLSNSSYCIRCFHITIKSPNVLIIRTAGNPDRCFISEPAAENSCPRNEYLNNYRQMILYRTSKDIKKVHCPISGRYAIHYRQYKLDHPVECFSRTSEISNCPVGSELQIHFQDCPFESHDITFECLGSWNGPNNQQYLALFDTRSGEERRPQYRCGLYLEDSGTGMIYIAFSSDSTCHTDLKSSQSGFETLTLTPYSNSQPNFAKCRFPDWTVGEWDSATVSEYVFSYLDNVMFKTYSFQCLNYDESEKRYDFPITGNDEKKMVVYGKTRCGEELHTCLWTKRRGINVFEFQLGRYSSPHYNASLCSSFNFHPSSWITEARQNYLANSPCPIEGEYVGIIPNADGLCAKLSSDCSSLDTMYYTVSDCSQQAYEAKGGRYRRANEADTFSNEDDRVVKSTSSNSLIENRISLDTNVSSSALVNTSSSVSNLTSNSIIETNSSTVPPLAINDSLAVETIVDASKMTETNNVRSYFVENRNFPAFIYEDARVAATVAKTFLPHPVSSSTLPAEVTSYLTEADRHRQFESVFYRQPNADIYEAEYRQSDDEHFSTSQRNRSRPLSVRSGTTSNSTVGSGQIYFVDPNVFVRRTVIALPPIQLPPSPETQNPMRNIAAGVVSRRNLHHRTFKDREYRCLGQWQENGLTYTFAERKQVGTYECFVGVPITETEFSIREAGRHCERDNEALESTLSMILTKKSSCPNNFNISSTLISAPTPSSLSTLPPTTTPQKTTVTTIKYTPKSVTASQPPLTMIRAWRPITNITRPQSPFRSKDKSHSNYGVENVPLPLSNIIVLISIYTHYVIGRIY